MQFVMILTFLTFSSADTGHAYPWKVYDRRRRKVVDYSYMDVALVMEKAVNHEMRGNSYMLVILSLLFRLLSSIIVMLFGWMTMFIIRVREYRCRL